MLQFTKIPNVCLNSSTKHATESVCENEIYTLLKFIICIILTQKWIILKGICLKTKSCFYLALLLFQSVRVCMLSRFGNIQLCGTLQTVACRGPLSMGLSRQEYWSCCHALLQGILPTQGSNLHLLSLLHWHTGSLPLAPLGIPKVWLEAKTKRKVWGGDWHVVGRG